MDKQRLFTGIITTDVAQEEDLGAFARQHLADVMQPHPLRLRRVLIGEADRFPELAQAWYAAGPERSYTLFANRFRALDRRGLLRVDNPLLAAQHFNWLILSIPLNKAMACPVDGPLVTRRELSRPRGAAAGRLPRR